MTSRSCRLSRHLWQPALRVSTTSTILGIVPWFVSTRSSTSSYLSGRTMCLNRIPRRLFYLPSTSMCLALSPISRPSS
ncbi:hypothetical protein EV182_006435, partial [Spiromyces aspiralis]